MATTKRCGSTAVSRSADGRSSGRNLLGRKSALFRPTLLRRGGYQGQRPWLVTLEWRIINGDTNGGAIMPYGGNDWLALTQEPTLEPEIPICDPHHHFWDLRPERIPYQRYLASRIGRRR